MNERTTTVRSIDEIRSHGGPRLLALGMWIRFMLVGAFVGTGSLVSIAVSEGTRAPALGIAFVGFVMAVIGWRRAGALFGASGLAIASEPALGPRYDGSCRPTRREAALAAQ